VIPGKQGYRPAKCMMLVILDCTTRRSTTSIMGARNQATDLKPYVG
jgi:hypothetical protein